MVHQYASVHQHQSLPVHIPVHRFYVLIQTFMRPCTSAPVRYARA